MKKRFLHLCIIFTMGLVCLFLAGFAFLQLAETIFIFGTPSIPVYAIFFCLSLVVLLSILVTIVLKGED